MKRTTCLVLLALVFAAALAHAEIGLAIGAEGTLDITGAMVPFPGAMLTFHPPGMPLMFGFGVSFQASLAFGMTVDLWLFRSPLIGIFSIYLGPGLYMILGDVVNIGIRIPVGLQLFIIDPFEIFLEISPHLGADFTTMTFPTLGLVGALGFRFWF